MLKTISIFSVLIPLIIGLINFKNLEANAKILLLIVAFASIPQTATFFSNDIPVVYYNAYILVEAIFCPILFLHSSKKHNLKTLLSFILICNFLIPLSTIIYLGPYKRFYSELVAVNSIFQMILITIYFYELNLSSKIIILTREPMFWFSTGILFYSPCTFFVFLFYKEVSHYFSKSSLNSLWDIHHIFNILLYILYAKGLSLKTKKYE